MRQILFTDRLSKRLQIANLTLRIHQWKWARFSCQLLCPETINRIPNKTGFFIPPPQFFNYNLNLELWTKCGNIENLVATYWHMLWSPNAIWEDRLQVPNWFNNRLWWWIVTMPSYVFICITFSFWYWFLRSLFCYSCCALSWWRIC